MCSQISNSSSSNNHYNVVVKRNNTQNKGQVNKNSKGNGNGRGEVLPQTGETNTTAAVDLGIVSVVVIGVIFYEKKN